jgi:uncharacterized protein
MGIQENVDLVRRGYQAFGAGDLATLKELFTEDAVWTVPGQGVLSGTKQGRDAVLAHFGELATRTAGTVRAELQDVIGGEEHTIGLHHDYAERNGKVFDQDAVLVFHISGGRVDRVQEFLEDPAAADEFWI